MKSGNILRVSIWIILLLIIVTFFTISNAISSYNEAQGTNLNPNHEAIIGGVRGFLEVIVFLGIIIFFWIKRNKQKK